MYNKYTNKLLHHKILLFIIYTVCIIQRWRYSKNYRTLINSETINLNKYRLTRFFFFLYIVVRCLLINLFTLSNYFKQKIMFHYP